LVPLATQQIKSYVGHANQSALYCQAAWGFHPLAFSGLETGNKQQASYVLVQDKIRLVLTSQLKEGGPINRHIDKHGDGVKVVALWVDDAKKSYRETIKRGARSYMEPKTLEDENGSVVLSGIHTYGETVHVFVERKNY